MKQKTNVTPIQKVDDIKENDDRSVVSSLSPREITPDVGRRNPAAIFSNVVFPHPEGPRTVNNSPFFNVKLTSLSAWTVSPFKDLKIIFKFWETKSLIKILY